MSDVPLCEVENCQNEAVVSVSGLYYCELHEPEPDERHHYELWE